MEKSASAIGKLKFATKRSFDVAFLSGESEANVEANDEAKDVAKKPKDREKIDERSSLVTNSE